jgi:hypothetical protein
MLKILYLYISCKTKGCSFLPLKNRVVAPLVKISLQRGWLMNDFHQTSLPFFTKQVAWFMNDFTKHVTILQIPPTTICENTPSIVLLLSDGYSLVTGNRILSLLIETERSSSLIK